MVEVERLPDRISIFQLGVTLTLPTEHYIQLYIVLAPRKIHTTTAASPVVEKGRTFQHRIRHSSTAPPPHMKKDKDHATPGGKTFDIFKLGLTVDLILTYLLINNLLCQIT